MDWQLAIVMACVAAAAVYIARATWRTWHPKSGGCGGGCCGKGAQAEAPATFIPAERLSILRR